MKIVPGRIYPLNSPFIQDKRRTAKPLWAHHLPTFIPVKTDVINNNMPAKSGREGGNNLMAKNLEELRKENPKLATTIEVEVKAAASGLTPVDAAIQAERRRLKEIDDIAMAIDDDVLVHEAKYGTEPCTASKLALRATLNKAVDCGVSVAKGSIRRD